jgi:hypothetical protein
MKCTKWILTTGVAFALSAVISFADYDAGSTAETKIATNFWRSTVQLRAVRSNITNRGTGFLVCQNIVRPGGSNRIIYLVTCKHMLGDYTIFDGNIGNYYETLNVFFYNTNRKHATFKLVDAKGQPNEKIYLHPDPHVDVALIALLDEYSVDILGDSVYLDRSLLLNFTNQNVLSYGETVMALGYPNGISSSRENHPLVKAGEVSNIPGEEFILDMPGFNRAGVHTNTVLEGKVYLVNGLLVPGNSGGPVIIPAHFKFRYNPETQQRQVSKPIPNMVVGIVSMGLTESGLSVIYSSNYIMDLLKMHEDTIIEVNGNLLLRIKGAP